MGSRVAAARAVSVLVVDDDFDIRDLLIEILQDAGFSVVTASQGSEALTLLRTVRPDVILLDVNMPVMNGFEFRRAQRRDPTLRVIPTVVMTAVDLEQDRLAELAADGALGKPISLPDLLSVVERYCTRPAGGSSRDGV
jgi:CheY-like chemotaxis protein